MCTYIIHRSLVNSPNKGHWRGALMFSLICVWINGWINNGEAGDLRCHRAHYDITVMNLAGSQIAALCDHKSQQSHKLKRVTNRAVTGVSSAAVILTMRNRDVLSSLTFSGGFPLVICFQSVCSLLSVRARCESQLAVRSSGLNACWS